MSSSAKARQIPKRWCPVDPTYILWLIWTVAAMLACVFILVTSERHSATWAFWSAAAVALVGAAFYGLGDWQQNRVVRWTKEMARVVEAQQPADANEDEVSRLQRFQALAQRALVKYGLPRPRQRAVVVAIGDTHPVWWRAWLGRLFPRTRSEGSSNREKQTIWLSSDSANPIALLHEASHLIVFDWHSNGFVRVLSDLVSDDYLPLQQVEKMWSDAAKAP